MIHRHIGEIVCVGIRGKHIGVQLKSEIDGIGDTNHLQIHTRTNGFIRIHRFVDGFAERVVRCRLPGGAARGGEGEEGEEEGEAFHGRPLVGLKGLKGLKEFKVERVKGKVAERGGV
mgnify:CR=1 FL=1